MPGWLRAEGLSPSGGRFPADPAAPPPSC